MRWWKEYVTQQTERGKKDKKKLFFTVMTSSLPVLKKREQIRKIKKMKDRKHLGPGFHLSDLTEHDFLSRCTLETSILIPGVCSYELCSVLEQDICLKPTVVGYFNLVAFPTISKQFL